MGNLHLPRGYFIYVGSAFSPAGVKARVEHYLNYSRRPHWHLDYLRAFMQLDEVWFSYDTVRREHQWADELSSLRGSRKPVLGFGASDGDCKTHFFAFGYKRAFATFRRRMHVRAEGYTRIYWELPGGKRA